MNRSQIISLCGGAGIVLLLGLFLIAPLVVVLGRVLIGEIAFLDLVAKLFGDPDLLDLLANSVVLATMSTVAAVAIALPLGYLLGRYLVPGERLLFLLLLAPLVLPPFVAGVGIRKLFARFGPINVGLMELGLIEQPIDWLGGGGLLPIAITNALHLFPIVLLNVMAALQQLDPSLEGAARTLGARPLLALRRVVLPLLMTGTLAGASIVFLWSFTDLGTPIIFEYERVLPVRVFQLVDEMHSNPLAYAVVVLLLVITLGWYLATKPLIDRARVVRDHHGAVRPRLTGPRGVIAAGGIALVGLIAALPHAGVFLLATGENWFFAVLPGSYSGEAFAALSTHPIAGPSIVRSVGLSVVATILAAVVGLIAAVIIVRGERRVGLLLDVVVMAPLAIPGIVIAFGYLDLFAGTPLDPRLNPLPLLAIGYAVRRLPFIVRSVVAGLETSARSLEEVARTLGASRWRVARTVTIPLLKPHLVAGMILCFSFAMLEVSESLILAMEDRFYPMTKAMYALLARPDGPIVASAMGVVGTVVVALCLTGAARVSGKGLRDVFRW